MGLLGVDRDDVDECLLGCCGEDGYEGQHYREVDLTVFMGGRRAAGAWRRGRGETGADDGGGGLMVLVLLFLF